MFNKNASENSEAFLLNQNFNLKLLNRSHSANSIKLTSPIL